MTAVFHIAVCRKPIEGTVAANVIKYGVGGLNIDACRVFSGDSAAKGYTVKRMAPGATINKTGNWKQEIEYTGMTTAGRWPANIIHDGSPEVVCEFPTTTNTRHMSYKRSGGTFVDGIPSQPEKDWFVNESGSASRFFKGITT